MFCLRLLISAFFLAAVCEAAEKAELTTIAEAYRLTDADCREPRPFCFTGTLLSSGSEYSRIRDATGGIPLLLRGVVTYYDLRSRDVLDACNLAQLKVPEQIGIIGSDDDASICEATIPSLTSVLPDFERSTYLATSEFNKIIRSGGRQARTVQMTYGVRSVSERESTMDFRGGGLLVSTACEYIRSYASDAPSVQDVANHCRVSRRLLELRFREINECSVREEIERTRLKKVCTLLRETKIPLGEIARRTGYASQPNLCALFRKRFGCSMRDFRNGRPPHATEQKVLFKAGRCPRP